MVAIRAAASRSEEVCTVLVMGYELGISVCSAACMNDLGSLYYMGELVPQDYARAAKLYEQAMDHGCFQSIINLGYIYEYSRTGEADHQKAYQCYALASALQPSCEAVYKLGDMYSRGEAVPSSMGKACQLWERSLELAESVVERLSHLCESLRQSSTPHAKSGEKNTTPSVRCLCFSGPKLGCV